MNRQCFVIKVGLSPNITPINIDMNERYIKLSNIHRGVAAVTFCTFPFVSGLTNNSIVWQRIIATASLNKPSPKIVEKSFGYSSNLTIVTAAIMSELHKIEHTKNMCIVSS